jgi:hypothetical protein
VQILATGVARTDGAGCVGLVRCGGAAAARAASKVTTMRDFMLMRLTRYAMFVSMEEEEGRAISKYRNNAKRM